MKMDFERKFIVFSSLFIAILVNKNLKKQGPNKEKVYFFHLKKRVTFVSDKLFLLSIL